MSIYLIFLISVLTSSCGVSKEVRTASVKLVSAQELSIKSHLEFHKAIIKSLTTFLDSELSRSQNQYESALKIQKNALLDEIQKIYSDESLSLAQKKVEEEKTRQTINENIQRIQSNKDRRDILINSSKEKLELASKELLLAENEKLKVVTALDKYLQTKRPSEKILETINIDIDEFTAHVDEANLAIEGAQDIVDKLNKLKK